MKIKLSERKIWNGEYNGIGFEINNYPTGYQPGDSWTYYIFLWLDRIPKENNPDSYWIKPDKKPLVKSHVISVSYDYMRNKAINDIDFHYGCTYYSKEAGHEGGSKLIKIGCDYQHYWDEGRTYVIDEITCDVKNSIDKFKEVVPNYKYRCYGNGKLYNIDEGEYVDGSFRSDEYFKKERTT